MFMLPLFVLLRRITEPIFFLSPFFPPMWKRKRWIFRASASTEKVPLSHPWLERNHVKKRKKHFKLCNPLSKFFEEARITRSIWNFTMLLFTRPLPRDGGMAEDHGAPEAEQLPRVWTRGCKEIESRQGASGAKSP